MSASAYREQYPAAMPPGLDPSNSNTFASQHHQRPSSSDYLVSNYHGSTISDQAGSIPSHFQAPAANSSLRYDRAVVVAPSESGSDVTARVYNGLLAESSQTTSQYASPTMRPVYASNVTDSHDPYLLPRRVDSGPLQASGMQGQAPSLRNVQQDAFHQVDLYQHAPYESSTHEGFGIRGQGDREAYSISSSKPPLAVESDNGYDPAHLSIEHAEGTSTTKKQKLTRIHQACVPCGTKKQKCNGEHPCAPCTLSGQDCYYKESKKRGPPKGTKRAKRTEAQQTAESAKRRRSDPSPEVTDSSAVDVTGKGEKHFTADSRISPQSMQNEVYEQQADKRTTSNRSNPAALVKMGAMSHRPSLATDYIAGPQRDVEPHLPPTSGYEHSLQIPNQPYSDGLTTSQSSLLPTYDMDRTQRSHHQPNTFGAVLPPTVQNPQNRLDATTSHTASYTPGFAAGASRNTPQPSLTPYHSGFPIADAVSRSASSTKCHPTGSPVFSWQAPLTGGLRVNHEASATAVLNSTTFQNDFGIGTSLRAYRSDVPDGVLIEEAEDVSDARMLLFENLAGSPHASEYDELDPENFRSDATSPNRRTTLQYRGASSGIPGLHTRHAMSSDASAKDARFRTRSISDTSHTYSHKTGPQERKGSDWLHPTGNPAQPNGNADQSSGSPEGAYSLPPIQLIPSRRNCDDSRSIRALTDCAIPQSLFESIITCYFAVAHHSCPIIYKPDIDLDNIEQQLPSLLLNAMCCLAVRFLDGKELARTFSHLRQANQERLKIAREQIEQHFYDKARKQIQEDDYHSNITSLQALILLSKRDNACGRVLHCWQLVGAATRMIIDLGMHRRAKLMFHGSKFTYAQIETRRRIFWQVYMMDKHAAASLGRPVFLREEDVDVLLPGEVSSDEFEIWQGVYPAGLARPECRTLSTHNALARLSIILQNIITDVYSTRARRKHFDISPNTGEYTCFSVLAPLYSQLQTWLSTLPSHLQWTPASSGPPPPPHHLLVHAYYNTCLLLLFRPVVPVSNQVAVAEQLRVPRPYDVCAQSADAITQIMDVYHDTYGLQRVASSRCVYFLFTAATIYVGNSSSLNRGVADAAKTGLGKCIKLLEHLSETCSTASQHRQILMDIMQLGDTKLKARDDAENLLSSRVPRQIRDATAASTEASALENSVDAGKVVEAQGAPAGPSAVSSLPGRADASKAVPNGMEELSEHQYSKSGHPHYLTTSPLPTIGAPASGDHPTRALPYTTNQADIAFWREMPLGEDPTDWNFFTDNYAQTLMTTMPYANHPYH